MAHLWQNQVHDEEELLLNQSCEAKDVYEFIKPTFTERVVSWFNSIGCWHKNVVLCKFKLVRSINPIHIGTSLEYQYIRLNLNNQHWKCFHCGKVFKAGVEPVTQQYREEHYREEHYL